MNIFVFFSSVAEKVTEELVVVGLELEDVQALIDDGEMLGALLAAVESGDVNAVIIDEV